MPIIGQISVGDGATFTPAVDNDGVISWSNNKNLPNPASVDIPQAVIDRYQLAPTSNPTFTGTVTADDVTASGDVGVGGDLSVTGSITGNLTGNADTSTNATNDGNGNNIANTYLPAVVGAVVAFAGNTSPVGWLLCDGSAVSRTDYAALFSVIGTTYGAGDGSTTFNLPDLVDKFIEGSSTAGTVKSAGLPNIEGSVTTTVPTNSASGSEGDELGTGAIYAKLTGNTWKDQTSSGTERKKANLYVNASLSSSIYGNSTTVQPPALTMRYIIKY